MEPRYEYQGPAELREPIDRSLRNVIDPEMAVGIVDLGLLHVVDVASTPAAVRMTMTSAACPVAQMIMADVEVALREVLGEAAGIHIELAWEPPWDASHMSEAARHALGWD